MINSTTVECHLGTHSLVSLLTEQESFHESVQDGYSGVVFVYLWDTDPDIAVTCDIKRHNIRHIVKWASQLLRQL